MSFVGLSWEVTTVTSTTRDDDGFPQVQMDGASPRGGSVWFEMQHSYGFYSRPRNPAVGPDGVPVQGSACSLFVATDGDQRYGWLGIDPRYLQSIPLVEPGGTSMYAVVEDEDLDEDGNKKVRAPFITIDGDDGTLTIYIPLKSGKAHTIIAGYDAGGEEYVTIASSSGAAITLSEGSCTMKNGDGSCFVSCTPDGIVMKGEMIMQGAVTTGGPEAQFLVTQAGLQALLGPIILWMAAGAPPGKEPAAIATDVGLLLTSPTPYTTVTKGS